MVDRCANPQCAKPLHYLREGRIFVFDVDEENGPGGKRSYHVEHYWLCGLCSQTLTIERTIEGFRPLPLRATARLRLNAG
jgi:hypothetical protein